MKVYQILRLSWLFNKLDWIERKTVSKYRKNKNKSYCGKKPCCFFSCLFLQTSIDNGRRVPLDELSAWLSMHNKKWSIFTIYAVYCQISVCNKTIITYNWKIMLHQNWNVYNFLSLAQINVFFIVKNHRYRKKDKNQFVLLYYYFHQGEIIF